MASTRVRLDRRVSSAAGPIMAGTVFGQLVAFATMPVLTRLYDPTTFGHFGIFAALVAIFGVTIAGRLDLAIPIPRSHDSAAWIMWTGIVLAAVIGLLLTLLGGLLALFILPNSWSFWTVILVGPASTMMATSLLLTQFLLRERRFGSVARRNFVFQPSIVGVQGLLGAMPLMRGAGLTTGYIAGHTIGTVVLYAGLPRRVRCSAQRRKLLRILRPTLSRFSNFLKLATPSAALNAIGMQLPLLLMALLYGPSVAGHFTLTQRLLSAPIMLVGTALGQVYVANLAGGVGPGTRRTFLRYSYALGLVSLTLGVGIAFSPPLVTWLLGSEWSVSAQFAAILAPSFALQLLASPLSVTVTIAERLDLQLAWDIVRVVGVSATMLIAASLGWTPMQAVFALSLVLTALYSASWMLSLKATAPSRQDAEVTP